MHVNLICAWVCSCKVLNNITLHLNTAPLCRFIIIMMLLQLQWSMLNKIPLQSILQRGLVWVNLEKMSPCRVMMDEWGVGTGLSAVPAMSTQEPEKWKKPEASSHLADWCSWNALDARSPSWPCLPLSRSITLPQARCSQEPPHTIKHGANTEAPQDTEQVCDRKLYSSY